MFFRKLGLTRKIPHHVWLAKANKTAKEASELQMGRKPNDDLVSKSKSLITALEVILSRVEFDNDDVLVCRRSFKNFFYLCT